MSSGLGGLGFDGINGSDESDGDGDGASDLPGDGNRGSLFISAGDIAGESG
jgi:hypothetical protein